MASRTGRRHTLEERAQGAGLRVIAILAALTIIEYAIAVLVPSPSGLLVLLALMAGIKAWLIVRYFMHLPLVWRRDGGH